MQRIFPLFLIVLLPIVVLAACGGGGGETAADQKATESPAVEAAAPQAPAAPREVSFTDQVAPIFAAKCNGCHHPDNAVKVDLTRPFHPELGLIDRPNTWIRSTKKVLVVPGDPEASALIWKVEQTELEAKVDGDPMPWHIDLLTARELDDLRRWILEGAEDDTLYRNTITRILGDGISLGSRGGKCSYCHYPGAAYGPDLTDLFDPDRGSVNIASDYGGIRVVPGDPEASLLFTKVRSEPLPPNLGRPMPLHPERLTAEEQQILRDWIAEGARNN